MGYTDEQDPDGSLLESLVAPMPIARRKRTLTDSEARWEAVLLIDASVQAYVHDGCVGEYGAEHGWTTADVIAVENHAVDRVLGLVRRPRKALVSTEGERHA